MFNRYFMVIKELLGLATLPDPRGKTHLLTNHMFMF